MPIAIVLILLLVLLWAISSNAGTLLVPPTTIRPARAAGGVPYSSVPGGGANISSLLKSVLGALAPQKAQQPQQRSSGSGGGSGASGGGGGVNPAIGPGNKNTGNGVGTATGAWYQDPITQQWYDPQGRPTTVVQPVSYSDPSTNAYLTAQRADNQVAQPPVPQATLQDNPGTPLDLSNLPFVGSQIIQPISDSTAATPTDITSVFDTTTVSGLTDGIIPPNVDPNGSQNNPVLPVTTIADLTSGIGASATGDATGTLDYTTQPLPSDGTISTDVTSTPDTSSPVGIDSTVFPVTDVSQLAGGWGGTDTAYSSGSLDSLEAP